MAAKEIKSISVPPSAEEDTINQWQAFGWEFKSTQEVKTQDVQVFTGQDNDGTEHYRTTRGEHYIKLTFERDPSRQNYAKLCDLEERYNAPSYVPTKPTEPTMPTKRGCLTIISILLIILGVYLVGVCLINNRPPFLILPILLILILPGAILMMIQRGYSKKYTEWETEHADWETEYVDWQKNCDIHDSFMKERPEIIKHAKELL
jgi:hypothetical protein